MTVTSIAVAKATQRLQKSQKLPLQTLQRLFGMCDCMVDSDVGTGEFFARAWTCTLAIARISRHGLSFTIAVA